MPLFFIAILFSATVATKKLACDWEIFSWVMFSVVLLNILFTSFPHAKKSVAKDVAIRTNKMATIRVEIPFISKI